MSDELRVDITPDPELKIDADGTFEVPIYDIPPEDQHIVQQVLAMDPIKDVPGPFRGFEGRKQPDLTLAALPPELGVEIERKLAMVPASKRAESEREFVRQALEANSLSIRTQAGVGATALPIHKAQAELAAQYRGLERRFDAISGELTDVLRYDVENSHSGERVLVPVYSVQGAAREKLVREQEGINYHMGLLAGVEGQRRQQKALKETVELIKSRNAAVAEEREVQSRAEVLVRESRIDKRAKARARMIDPNVN